MASLQPTGPMDQLILRVAPDDDGSVELKARVEAGGFAGLSSAWFTLDHLTAFCQSLSTYPVAADRPLSLAGGYWNEAGELSDTHLSIQIAPLGGRGELKVSVELATSPGAEFVVHQRQVSTAFIVGYNDLQAFQSALAKVLQGASAEAVLTSTMA